MIFLYGFLGLVPAGVMIYSGVYIRRTRTHDRADRQILVLLLAALLMMAAGVVLADYQQSSSFLLMGILPVMIGLIPIIYLHWRDTSGLHTGKISAGMLGCLLILALLGVRFVQLHRDTSTIWFIVLGGGLTTVVWQVARRGALWRGLLVGLVMVVISIGLFTPNAIRATWPVTVRNLMAITSLVGGPVVAIALAGYLTYEAVTASQPDRHKWHRITQWVLLPILIGMLTAQHREAMILDRATDDMGSLVISMAVALAGFAVAMLLSWVLEGSHRLIGVGFGVALLLAIAVLGILAQPPRPDRVTDARARNIDTAIQHYFADTGQYPTDLLELTPRYLVVMPNPVLFRDQTWCYESGGDYYSLGYVYRQAFGVPPDMITIHEVAAAGKPPGDTWNCDAQLADYRSRYGATSLPPTR